MERQVTFRDRQEVTADDLNNTQAFTRESLDDLVTDAVTTARKFAGFTVTQKSATTVQVAPGRLFAGGERFLTLENTTLDLFPAMPLTAEKIIPIVAWGNPNADLAPDSRDFMIDADSGETEPQPVSMESRRVANLAIVGTGNEGPDPQPPVVDGTYLIIAYVRVSSVAIETIVMIDDNRVPNAQDHESRIETQEEFAAATGPRISTIASDIANLSRRIAALGSAKDLSRVYADVARLKEKAGLPSTFSEYEADYFADETHSATTDGAYRAFVDEGLHFPNVEAGSHALALYTPNDSGVMVSADGLMLPRYTSIKRIGNKGYALEISCANYGFQPVRYRHKKMSRCRFRHGHRYKPCSASENWLWGREWNPYDRLFRFFGESHFLGWGNYFGHEPFGYRHEQILKDYFQRREHSRWEDRCERRYWPEVVVNHDLVGAHIAQTFLNSQDGWLTQVKFCVTRKAAGGDIYVSISECREDGSPDLDSVVAHATLPWSAITTSTTVPVTVNLPPTYLDAGSRYAILLTTNANHYFGLSPGGTASGAAGYSQGSLFSSTDGVYYMVDPTKDLMFEAWFAQFNTTRAVVAMNPISFSGGISDIDILAEAIVPKACSLVWEVQAPGQPWKVISGDDYDPDALALLPTNVSVRVTMIGTADVAAGISLTQSNVTWSRADTDMVHVSTAFEPLAPSLNFEVQAQIENWNSDHHTVRCFLETPAGEVEGLVEESLYSGTTLQRSWTFTIEGDPVAAPAIKIVGHTTTNLDVFAIANRVDMALSAPP